MNNRYEVLLICSNTEEYQRVLELQEALLSLASKHGFPAQLLKAEVRVVQDGRDLQRSFLDNPALKLAIIYAGALSVAVSAMQDLFDLFPDVGVFLAERGDPQSDSTGDEIVLRSIKPQS